MKENIANQVQFHLSIKRENKLFQFKNNSDEKFWNDKNFRKIKKNKKRNKLQHQILFYFFLKKRKVKQ